MNIENLQVPFTQFYLWRTERSLHTPLECRHELLRSIETSGVKAIAIKVKGTRRVNRVERKINNRSRKVDVGLALHTNSDARFSGHAFLPSILGLSNKAIVDYRITSTQDRRNTVMWYESSDSAEVHIPRHIVFTDRGWQTLAYFVANPHLKLYRPTGKRHHFHTLTNFIEIDRDSMAYDPRYGWFDTTKHAVLRVEDLPPMLHDTSVTYTWNGSELPISSGVVAIENIAELRVLIRETVHHVLSGALKLEDGIRAIRLAMVDCNYAKTTYNARGNGIVAPELLWKGLWTSKPILIAIDKARILREISMAIPMVMGAGYRRTNCNTCGNYIYTWNSTDTATVDMQEMFGDDWDDYLNQSYVPIAGEPEYMRELHFCSDACLTNNSRLLVSTGIPNKYSYHTDVLGFIEMGKSDKVANKQGEKRRCGIELETLHEQLGGASLHEAVKKGSVIEKLKDKCTGKKINWNTDTYESFGAIPTRDGSIDQNLGVEWVFRPSDLGGLEQDVTNFLEKTHGFLHVDADENDSENRTYGLHIHVTATDTMKSAITRSRIAVVTNRLEKIFHSVGGRGYSDYTRRINELGLLRMDSVRELRNWHIRQMSEFPKWTHLVKPSSSVTCGALRERLRRGTNMPPRRQTLDNNGNDDMLNTFSSSLFVRYNIVNVSLGRPTVEFRHARSYADKDFIMLNAELAQSVALFATYEMMSIMQAKHADTPRLYKNYIMANHKEYPRMALWFTQNQHDFTTSGGLFRNKVAFQ